jgi:threonine aldolase
VVAPRERAAAWRRAGAKFYDWPTRALASELAPGPGETLLRFVTSFETSRAEIDELVAIAQRP